MSILELIEQHKNDVLAVVQLNPGIGQEELCDKLWIMGHPRICSRRAIIDLVSEQKILREKDEKYMERYYPNEKSV